MKIYENGVPRDMTTEEIEEMREAQNDYEDREERIPTTEERLADLEASNAELREALDLLLRGGTE